MLDRKKLAAPFFAQAAAFVVVLIIGGFTSHGSTPSGPAHTATPSVTASTRASASGTAEASKGASVKLTVRVVREGAGVLSASGSQVKVLQDGTLASVASGRLDSSLEFAANVPAGQYQVCLNPPFGWGSAVRTTHALAGWVCSAADARKGPQVVTFRLSPQLTQEGQ